MTCPADTTDDQNRDGVSGTPGLEAYAAGVEDVAVWTAETDGSRQSGLPVPEAFDARHLIADTISELALSDATRDPVDQGYTSCLDDLAAWAAGTDGPISPAAVCAWAREHRLYDNTGHPADTGYMHALTDVEDRLGARTPGPLTIALHVRYALCRDLTGASLQAASTVTTHAWLLAQRPELVEQVVADATRMIAQRWADSRARRGFDLSAGEAREHRQAWAAAVDALRAALDGNVRPADRAVPPAAFIGAERACLDGLHPDITPETSVAVAGIVAAHAHLIWRHSGTASAIVQDADSRFESATGNQHRAHNEREAAAWSEARDALVAVGSERGLLHRHLAQRADWQPPHQPAQV